ncbi:MAG: deoxyribonuclease IV [Pirellulaceae bacterium]|nr:deoxyribonuclease IV [Pirellulaceae bacterium]
MQIPAFSIEKDYQMTLLIGSHTSTAGGCFRAVEIAAGLGMKTCQLFTKNANQWRGKPIGEADVARFQTAVRASGLVKIISHTSYLINLASPNPELWQKSVDALVDEWQRAEQFSLAGLVMHPGSATDGDEVAGLGRIQAGILKAYDLAEPKTSKLLLENTAGQGTALGWKIEQLATLIDGLNRPNYLGICLDSCHAHAAGYDLAKPDGVDTLVQKFADFQILDRIHAIHLNDSKKAAGSRVDRHEHLGQGTLTTDGIRRFINHPSFNSIPMYLETEKGSDPNGRDWDAVNMEFAIQLSMTDNI